jgi:hypothetical protein
MFSKSRHDLHHVRNSVSQLARCPPRRVSTLPNGLKFRSSYAAACLKYSAVDGSLKLFRFFPECPAVVEKLASNVTGAV